MNNSNKWIKVLFVTVLLFQAAGIFAGGTDGLKVIRDPKPNMSEGRYIPLEEVGTVDEDLGNDNFIFSPFSFTSDRQKNVYVYDDLQKKIFQLDKDFKLLKSFGNKGFGPGEFSGGSGRNPVRLNIGADGHLYANDFRARKVIVFSPDGRYMNEYHYERNSNKVKRPIVDREGNLYIYTLSENRVTGFINQEKSPLVTMGPLQDIFSFLYARPAFLDNPQNRRYKYDLVSTALEMPMADMTPASRVIFFFPNSSTLYVLDKGKVIHRSELWPKDALEYHKKNLPAVMKQSKDVVRNMFINLFADDESETFYLQLGRNEDKGINALYKFDLKGKLLSVFYIKYGPSSAFTLFRLRHNGGFLAIKDDKINKYKEKT